MTELVTQHQNKITTTSVRVAEIFQKDHKNVLRDIKDLKCSPEFWRLNFEPSEYTIRGKKYPLYFITRDGFAMLAMGFTGDKAATFKEAFINAFNQLEQAVRAANTPNLIPVYQNRIMSKPTLGCPANRWCIFDLAHEIMLMVEMGVGSVNQYDLVDGSIGIHWVKFREGKAWRCQLSQYWHHHKDVRGKQLSNCFHYEEQEYFKVWLRAIYVPQHLADYLRSKFKKDKLMLARVEKFASRLIGGGDSSSSSNDRGA